MKKTIITRDRPAILLVLVLITFLLGLWQCFRLYGKLQIINSQLANQAGPALLWYTNPNLTLADRGKKFVVAGRLFPDKTIYLLTLAPDESEARGYQPIMPLLTTSGEWLLVSLGFYQERVKSNITSDLIDADVADYLRQLAGREVRLTLYADPIKRKGFFTPDDITTSKIWFYINRQQLADKWAMPIWLSPRPTNDFLFAVAAIDPAPRPIDGKPAIRFFVNGLPLPYNHHVEYILTWWALALAGFLFYWFGGAKKKIAGKKLSKNKKK